MKLSASDSKQLFKIVQTCNKIGIESLVVDQESIRGMNAEKTLLLINENDIDMSELGAIAIGANRVGVLTSRLNLVKLDDALAVDANVRTRDNGDKFIDKLSLKNKRTTVEFKCSDPNQVNALRKLKSPMTHSFKISDDSIDTLIRGNTAMQNDNISFSLEDGVVYFKLNDSSGDKLNHVISESINTLDDQADTSFFFNYNKKLILPLLKMALSDNSEVEVGVNKRGIMNIVVGALNIYLIPEL